MAHVLLLREPSIDPPDRYESAFKEAGYRPTSIPVLETVHTNISRLGNLIKDGPESHRLAGVIITSRRSCDAWSEALRVLAESGDSRVADWSDVPFYVVGQPTATALREVFAKFKYLGLGSPDIRGQDSGNAATLAPFILDDMQERSKELLYLTGDKNRDTISRLLTEGGISLEPLQVYKTEGSSAFEDDLVSALASSPKKDSESWWIVYFAPSAAAFVTPILHQYFHLESSTALQLPHANVAAIGPTTKTFLTDELHLHVHAMPEKPIPENLVSVVAKCDSNLPKNITQINI